MKSFVYIDHFKGEVQPASWEALGLGKSIGLVSAVVFGSAIDAIAETAFEYGADNVLMADDAALLDYRAEPFVSTLTALAAAERPDAILFPGTTRGRELAAMLAIDLNTGVITDVTALETNDDLLVATRPIYEGQLFEKTSCSGRPQILTIRARAFSKPTAESGKTGAAARVEVRADALTRVEGYAKPEAMVNLTDAPVVVSGGRGLADGSLQPPAGLDDQQADRWRGQQGFRLIGELAAVLGGAIGASRVAVDAGYIPYANQVGQTGKSVAPDLYIACGISGAIQHIAGIRSAKLVVAINKDPEAPIFKAARYGVVGDLFQIVPALTKAFRQKLGK